MLKSYRYYLARQSGKYLTRNPKAAQWITTGGKLLTNELQVAQRFVSPEKVPSGFESVPITITYDIGDR